MNQTVGKGEIARNEQFLLFPQQFLRVWRTFFHIHYILNSRLQTLSVWKCPKFVVWERVEKNGYYESDLGKREHARNEQFLIFPQHFPHVWRTFFHIHYSLNSRLQTPSVWKCPKFVVWERVKKSGYYESNLEKEKLLVKCNFSFSHIIFCSCVMTLSV